MTAPGEPGTIVGLMSRLEALDAATAALVRLSARITGGTETDVREGLAECGEKRTPERWIEELVLQSYLFAGFPRALNAVREWQRTTRGQGSGRGAQRGSETEPVGLQQSVDGYQSVYAWRERGEEACRVVYGEMYEKLRENIRGLHPAMDDWMIVEGYGKVLSRDGLDLPRRELCIVAACVAAGQERQLHSHLHGSRNAGVPDGAIEGVLAALDGVVPAESLKKAQLLWQRVKGK